MRELARPLVGEFVEDYFGLSLGGRIPHFKPFLPEIGHHVIEAPVAVLGEHMIRESLGEESDFALESEKVLGEPFCVLLNLPHGRGNIDSIQIREVVFQGWVDPLAIGSVGGFQSHFLETIPLYLGEGLGLYHIHPCIVGNLVGIGVF